MEMMWIMTKPLWVTGNMRITVSGFSILNGLIGMYERGVYVSALLKKCIYFP